MLPSVRSWFMGRNPRAPQDGPSSSGSSGSSDSRANAGGIPDDWQPSFADVCMVKAMLGKAYRLPLELVDDVIDLAEYWPHSTTIVDYQQHRERALRVGNSQGQSGNMMLLRTPPLGFFHPPNADDADETDDADYLTKTLTPRRLQKEYSRDQMLHFLGPQAPALEHPCRKIVFTLISHDQGWSNHRNAEKPFEGAYSWFDVGLERYDAADAVHAADTTEEAATDVGSSRPPPLQLHALRSVIPPVRELALATGEANTASTAEEHEDESENLTFYFPLLPDEHRLQSNRVATRTIGKYKITWSWTDTLGRKQQATGRTGINSDGVGNDDEDGNDDDNKSSGDMPSEEDREAMAKLELQGRGSATADGSFVRNLRVGDVVTLWAKARFPGWANVVQLAQVDVYWAV